MTVKLTIPRHLLDRLGLGSKPTGSDVLAALGNSMATDEADQVYAAVYPTRADTRRRHREHRPGKARDDSW